MIPKTAGQFVTERELRTYTKCSQLHFYGGGLATPPITSLTKYVFEALTSNSLRKEIQDPLFLMQKHIIRGCRELDFHNQYLEDQVRDFKHRTTLVLTNIFEIFSFQTYIPVFGPFQYQVKVHKTPVTLELSGIYRTTKNQTLHLVTFSPYQLSHAITNDPTTQLKIQTLRHMVKEHASGRPQTKLHIFGVTATDNQLLYHSKNSEELAPSTLYQTEQLVKQLETGVHYPLVPCPHHCPFKQKCYPEKP